MNHPAISGNKLFKLKHNLDAAKNENKKILLTFGGAFSNHIAATAAAGKEFGFNTIGIIRGEEYEILNPTLKFAIDCGMKIHYVSRKLYQNKDELYKYVNDFYLKERFYLIPEGGSNDLGVLGCKEITQHIKMDFDYVCCACGTGATLAGVILSLKKTELAMGFQVLKAENYIKNEVNNWLQLTGCINLNKWHINDNYHFGGYAKVKPELINFVERFEKANNIPLDYVYTGKMMFGIYDLIQKNYFKKNQIIVAIHTGGLQGNKGFGRF
jgi:1-aminocyclopropane-1-carboxylate deaminase/D-cysteine desulfhydrase-like pyridoxal-dependent ACC family enzyme